MIAKTKLHIYTSHPLIILHMFDMLSDKLIFRDILLDSRIPTGQRNNLVTKRSCDFLQRLAPGLPISLMSEAESTVLQTR
jgi:hypothetical protein